MEIFASTQNPMATQKACAKICGVPSNKVSLVLDEVYIMPRHATSGAYPATLSRLLFVATVL